MRKTIIFISAFVLLAIVGVIIFYFFSEQNISELSKISEWQNVSKVEQDRCLKEDEVATYGNDKSDFVGKIEIFKKNKQTNEIISSFKIDDVPKKHYHPVELYNCGIYVLKSFNYDYKFSKVLPGFSEEIWYYDYTGNGRRLLVLSEESEAGVPDAAGLPGRLYAFYYSYDFRISPNEKYLVLEKSYLGKDDYALVIKDLETKEDLFVLKLKDILAQNPEILPGSISLGGWTKDGKYLRGDIFDGALDTAYYQIEAGTWKTEIYPSPSDLLAGVERAINYEKWRLAYVDIPTFTGIQEVYEQIIEKAKKEGKQKNLYLYNLITKEKIKIASAEPEWRFSINWLSDFELQYELPDEEKKIYQILRE